MITVMRSTHIQNSIASTGDPFCRQEMAKPKEPTSVVEKGCSMLATVAVAGYGQCLIHGDGQFGQYKG
jgi:hypothetical protein